MFERRSLLAGLAALPAAGLPIAASAAARPDTFAAFHAEVLALHAAHETVTTDEAAAAMMERWGEIDAAVMRRRPETLAEAASALDYARREYVQFTLMDDETGADDGERLILHVLDGVIGLLRRAGAGGAA